MATCDYLIEELELEINGCNVWADGSVEVAYTYQAPQHSVGFSGGVVIDSFGPMRVDLTDENREDCGKITCKPGDAIFDQIIKALGDERIERAIADGEETF